MPPRFAAIVAFVDSADFMYPPVKTYSGGMMMLRLAFAPPIHEQWHRSFRKS